MMKQIFSIDGPYYRVMAYITDIFLINLLFLLSCLTVVGSGPGLIALYHVSEQLLSGNEKGIVKLYIAEFRNNLRRGFQLLGIVVLSVSGTLTLLYVLSLFSPVIAPILIFALAVILLILSTFILVFSNTEYTIQQSFDRSLYLVFRHIVVSISVIVIPVLTMWIIGKVGFYVELCFGLSLACLAQILFVKRIEIKL